jgi:hypothetical protein
MKIKCENVTVYTSSSTILLGYLVNCVHYTKLSTNYYLTQYSKFHIQHTKWKNSKMLKSPQVIHLACFVHVNILQISDIISQTNYALCHCDTVSGEWWALGYSKTQVHLAKSPWNEWKAYRNKKGQNSWLIFIKTSKCFYFKFTLSGRTQITSWLQVKAFARLYEH